MLGGVFRLWLSFSLSLQLSFLRHNRKRVKFFFCFFLIYLTALAFYESLAIICPVRRKPEENHRLRLLPEGHPDQHQECLSRDNPTGIAVPQWF